MSKRFAAHGSRNRPPRRRSNATKLPKLRIFVAVKLMHRALFALDSHPLPLSLSLFLSLFPHGTVYKCATDRSVSPDFSPHLRWDSLGRSFSPSFSLAVCLLDSVCLFPSPSPSHPLPLSLPRLTPRALHPSPKRTRASR